MIFREQLIGRLPPAHEEEGGAASGAEALLDEVHRSFGAVKQRLVAFQASPEAW